MSLNFTNLLSLAKLPSPQSKRVMMRLIHVALFYKAVMKKLVYITDTGVFCPESLEYVKNPNYLIIESNHDIQMLLHTERTYDLKAHLIQPRSSMQRRFSNCNLRDYWSRYQRNCLSPFIRRGITHPN